MTQWCNVLLTKIVQIIYSLFQRATESEVWSITSKKFEISLVAIAVKELRRHRRKNATRVDE